MRIVALANLITLLQTWDVYASRDVRKDMTNEFVPKEEDVQKTKEERQEELRRWFESLGDCA